MKEKNISTYPTLTSLVVSLKYQLSRVILLILFAIIGTSIIPCASSEIVSNLTILCPDQVNESYAFIVTIQSDNNIVANVTVVFNGEENLTNQYGKVTCYAPRILPDENKTYIISASKTGYNATTKNITILNIPQLFPIISPTHIEAGVNFTILITDDEGQTISNATITFNTMNYLSDKNGSITITAPIISTSNQYYLNITKVGYISNSIIINIVPGPSTENILGLYIAILIAIGIASTTVTLFIRNYLRHRRINK